MVQGSDIRSMSESKRVIHHHNSNTSANIINNKVTQIMCFGSHTLPNLGFLLLAEVRSRVCLQEGDYPSLCNIQARQ